MSEQEGVRIVGIVSAEGVSFDRRKTIGKAGLLNFLSGNSADGRQVIDAPLKVWKPLRQGNERRCVATANIDQASYLRQVDKLRQHRVRLLRQHRHSIVKYLFHLRVMCQSLIKRCLFAT